MKFYFSGVEGMAELEMLREAGATHLLVDPVQLARLHGELDGFRLALDSGSYRAWKAGKESNLAMYATIIESWLKRGYSFDFVTALDDLDDRAKNYRDWVDLCTMTENFARILPVWHWSPEPMDDLFYYIDESPHEVGMGGMVKYLFTKADRKEKAWCRKSATLLCQAYPGRFRLFGACDLSLLNAVQETAISADSSLWLRGKRRKTGFYIHRKTGRLAQASTWLMKKLADDYPEIGEILRMDDRQRTIHNAILLQRFFNECE